MKKPTKYSKSFCLRCGMTRQEARARVAGCGSGVVYHTWHKKRKYARKPKPLKDGKYTCKIKSHRFNKQGQLVLSLQLIRKA